MHEANLPEPSWRPWHDDEPIRLGISSCLLGAKVRFDGGHKRDRYLTDVLGEWFQWVAVCPELDIGLGVPRPTIRLVEGGDNPRLVEPKSGEDLTERMETYSYQKVDELMAKDLDGYILKRASPSCGMERVKVYTEAGMPLKTGAGVFARILMEKWPHLPVEEEGRLNDAMLRVRFIEHVFCRHRWRMLVRRGLSRRSLIEFHTAHKLLLRAHNEAGYRRLGKIVASAGTIPDAELFQAYEDEFHTVLKNRATRKRHTNVLYHVLGYLKKVLDPFEKQEAVALIEDYRNELVPLIVPITLLRHHITKHGIVYMQGQLYLEPHPRELMLRNRV
ncbi:MAG: DUF523 and DUF1722 domain-containing protein [Acidobacteria bacterium]|jgi:uncharacterized protein YbgA (DUF1722 family)/uncharacterized protein YbbK (DUF523 family)|nr:DUF523 and DUF1722 domain-containing protein [Acidobacteriota bacterium]